MTATPEFGILLLGIFVGSILGFGLAKAAITVLGSALGGGPILFVNGVGAEKWTYPVGLVLGLLVIRLWFAR